MSDTGDAYRGVVVITGASAGIGRAVVRRSAASGYDVGLIARGEDGLEAAGAEVRREGHRAVVVPCDVANAETVEAAATQIESELGTIDVWVNNAMVSDAVSQPRHDRTSRIRAGLPKYSLSKRLLCGQTCNCRIYGFTAL